MTQPTPNRLDVALTKVGDLAPIVAGLRVKWLGYLSAITGIDGGTEKNLIELLYHFCSGAAIITLRVNLQRDEAKVASLSSMLPNAEVFEREVMEMFGVEFAGLRNTARLSLSDDWPDGLYPMRKDADLTAFSQL
jgi:Ni,Fe-hydrogenase III component G